MFRDKKCAFGGLKFRGLDWRVEDGGIGLEGSGRWIGGFGMLDWRVQDGGIRGEELRPYWYLFIDPSDEKTINEISLLASF